MATRILLGVGTVAGVLIGIVALVAVLNVTVYAEASVPPRGDLPELPSGLRIVNGTAGCGSGNCYREFDVAGGSDETPESILSRLPTEEECSANSPVDRRLRCVGYRRGPDGVIGYVSLGKWWN